MNKKLFSWKALAGFALLVAMGLTSCNQSTVVDPTDPYSKKPVTPQPTAKGTTLSGFKNVAELNKLIAETKDITDNIKAGGSVTINLDCSNLEAAAGDKIIIPGKSDATINLVFANKAKKNEGLVIADDALDQLTITFPEGEFGDVAFEMPFSTLTLASAGASTLGNTAFSVNKNNIAELATTINSGITINSIKTWFEDATYGFQMTGDILAKDGATIKALTIDETYYDNRGTISNNDKGYNVPAVYSDFTKWTRVTVKDLNVVANHVAVGAYSDADEKTVVGKITIAEGDTVNVWGGYAEEIVGAGKGATLANFNNSTTVKYNNLTMFGGSSSWGEGKCTFEKCTLVDFTGFYLTQASATGLKFTFENASYCNVRYLVKAASDATTFKYPFDSCEFADGVSVSAYAQGENVLDKDGNPIKQTLYRYGYYDEDLNWKTVSGVEKFTDIPDSIRMNTTTNYSYYTDYIYEPKVINFKNLNIIPSFKSCKYKDLAISDKNYGLVDWTTLWDADDKECASVTSVEIDGKLYKRVNTKTNGWILVEQ